MSKKKLHPVYYKYFVGTWKRLSQTSTKKKIDVYKVFDENGRSYNIPEILGTVNGEVDEVSIDGDEMDNTRRKITGKIFLMVNQARFEWSFILQQSTDVKIIGSTGDKNGKRRMNELILIGGGMKQKFKLESASMGPAKRKKNKVQLNN